MKKKAIALFTALFMLLSLVGCNTQGLSLINELEKVGAWEATNESGTVSVTIAAARENVKVTGTYEAFTNSKELQMELLLTLKEIEMSGQKIDLTQGAFKFSPIKMYMDGVKFYISTSYIEDIARMAGANASEIVDVSKEYIAFDLADMFEASGIDIKELNQQSSANYDVYKDSKIELPLKQEGRKYTIDLTSDKMLDALFTFVIESFNSQEAVVKETYKAMGMSDAEIEETIAMVKEVYSDETKEMIKPIVEGSTAKVVYNFEDDKYTTNIDAALKFSIVGDEIALNLAMEDVVLKANTRTINFPTSVKTYTMEDLMRSLMSKATVQVAKAQVLVEEGITYVPARATLANVGIMGLTFNKAAQTITVEELGMDLPVIVKGGTSYLAIETLEALGFVIEVIG